MLEFSFKLGSVGKIAKHNPNLWNFDSLVHNVSPSQEGIQLQPSMFGLSYRGKAEHIGIRKLQEGFPNFLISRKDGFEWI